MIRALAAAALLLVAVAAPAAAQDFRALGLEPYEPRKPAPDFTLPDLDGRATRLSQYRGRVVVLVFWATWCPDCRKELPSLQTLVRAYRPRGVEAVLVSFREDAAHVREVARERGYDARILVDTTGDVTGGVYGVFGPPTVYLIDREGRLAARGVGPRAWDTDAARRVIEALAATGGGR